jgi:hypothetical protein
MPHKKLAEYVAVEPTRAQIVQECVTLVDEEVKNKSGLSGIAIKGAYSTVKAIKPGFVAGVVDALYDDWVAKLESHYDRWRGGGKGSLAEYLTSRSEDVAEDLLAVTDGRAHTTKYKAASKVYEKLRPSAKKNVSAAVPRLGALMERHVGS